MTEFFYFANLGNFFQIMEGDNIAKQKGVWIKENDEWIGEFYNVPGKVVVTIDIDKIIFSVK